MKIEEKIATDVCNENGRYISKKVFEKVVEELNNDWERFHKWYITPLQDIPDSELLWCAEQDRFNSNNSEAIFLWEINRRNLKK